MDRETLRKNETQAFHQAWRSFRRQKCHPSQARSPKRLYNILTGEFIYRTSRKAYVIVSYVWNPLDLSKFPPVSNTYDTANFDLMVDQTSRLKCLNGEPLLEIEHDFEKQIQDVEIPSFERFPQTTKLYFQEVFCLLAAEALRRKVEYVWMDSLCIDQENCKEKNEEIPYMADFYSAAVCCVVVSETLRRRYAHNWEDRGKDDQRLHEIDQINPSFLSEYQSVWGLHDEVAGWMIGFHETRVWVYQETYFAAELVHRGRNIRINSNAFLQGMSPNAGPRLSKNLVLGWKSIKQAERNELMLAWHRHVLFEIGFRMPFPQLGGIPWWVESVTHTMDLGINNPHKTCKLPQDAIFASLSFLAVSVRFSLPVRYDISRNAVATILIFLRICHGEVEALGPIRQRPAFGAHLISQAPSWIPTHAPVGMWANGKWDIILCEFSVRNARYLHLRGFSIKIKDVCIGLHCKPGEDETLYPAIYLIEGEKADTNLNGEMQVDYLHYFDEYLEPSLSISDMRDMEGKWARLRTFCATQSLVMVSLGSSPHLRCSSNSACLMWMVLTSSNDGVTWRREGWCRTKDHYGFTQTQTGVERASESAAFIVE